MKKFLPSKGFTLVELLVVISIIAILSVIGMIILTGGQKKARDAARKGDITAIAKVLELNKLPTGYQALTSSQFSNNTIPKDPQGISYCANLAVDGQPGNITAKDCSPTISYGPIGSADPSPYPPAGTAWKICAWLEGPPAGAFCVSSSQ